MTAAAQRCRFCGCTPERPCLTESGDECCYLGRCADRCSAKHCVLAFEAERDAEFRREAQRRKMATALRRRPAKKTKGRAR